MTGNRDAGIFAAVAGISAVVTAGFGWLELLLGWSICGLLRLCFPGKREVKGKFGAVLLIFGGIIIAAAATFCAEEAFPEDGTFPLVSLGVMALLWRMLIGSRFCGQNAGNVLGLILLPLLGALVIFGLGDINWPENIPTGMQWQQVWITVAVTSPWWVFSENRKWSWFSLCGGVSVGMCLLTRGILGGALVGQVEQPLYRAVQTIHVLGVLQRMEALLAAAVLLGSFGMMLLAGELIRRGIEILVPEGKLHWRFGVIVGGAFLLELACRLWAGPIQEPILAVFWGIVPLFALGIVLLGRIAEKA